MFGTARTLHRRRALAASAAVLVLGLAAGCAGNSTSIASAPAASVGTQMDSPVADSIMSLRLVDSNGTPTSLAALRGKILVISDTMSLCQETCPLDTTNIVAAARAVEKAGLGDKVRFLSITIDPARDTADQLHAYRALYTGAPADWMLLTGDANGVAQLWKYLGVYYRRVAEGNPPTRDWRDGTPLTYDLDHSDEVFFIDGRGHERFLLEGPGIVTPGTQVPKQLVAFLDAQGRQALTRPDAQSWTVPQVLDTVGWLSGKRVTAP